MKREKRAMPYRKFKEFWIENDGIIISMGSYCIKLPMEQLSILIAKELFKLK